MGRLSVIISGILVQEVGQLRLEERSWFRGGCLSFGGLPNVASVRCARPGAPRHLPSPLAVLGPTLASPREPGPWREVFIWEELDRHLSPFPLLSLCLSVCVFHSFPSLLSSSFPPSFSLPSIPVSPILFFLFSFFFFCLWCFFLFFFF